MVQTTLAYKQMPAEVTDQLRQVFGWLLWGVEVALIARLIWVGGRLGWEFFRPPPGPPAAPAEVARVLVSWIFATVAWPIAGSLLMDLAL
ncbi:hypothetical protein [Nocardia sp. CNY236]|uniref:hypothetical protein n=1 Tax=Nocardia sp. CNY236 TaxID=1169152 RepID=UPI0004135D8E|nr:hypothetical protein [Nocardia sp. CNY236]